MQEIMKLMRGKAEASQNIFSMPININLLPRYMKQTIETMRLHLIAKTTKFCEYLKMIEKLLITRLFVQLLMKISSLSIIFLLTIKQTLRACLIAPFYMKNVQISYIPSFSCV